MLKITAVISWIIAIAGTIAVVLATWFIDNYVMGFIGVILLIFGIIGVLLTGGKTKKYILNLLDFL